MSCVWSGVTTSGFGSGCGIAAILQSYLSAEGKSDQGSILFTSSSAISFVFDLFFVHAIRPLCPSTDGERVGRFYSSVTDDQQAAWSDVKLSGTADCLEPDRVSYFFFRIPIVIG